LIKKGAKSVDIIFDREYLEQPVVNANISVEASDFISEEEIFTNNIQYLITKKTTKGFTIILNKPAPNDIRFSWIALAVKSPKVFNSIEVVLTPSPTPLSVSPSETPGEQPAEPVVVAEPTPESTPEPAPETSVEPTPEPSVEPDSTEITPGPTL